MTASDRTVEVQMVSNGYVVRYWPEGESTDQGMIAEVYTSEAALINRLRVLWGWGEVHISHEGAIPDTQDPAVRAIRAGLCGCSDCKKFLENEYFL